MDVTLAIEVERERDDMVCPLEGFCDNCKGIKATTEIQHLAKTYDIDISSGHMVAKGGYWNISFANVESKLLIKLDDKWKMILRAIKVCISFV